jgi:tetratricopeptide (TPR) repeat protein
MVFRILFLISVALWANGATAQSSQALKTKAILAKGDTIKAGKKLDKYIAKHPQDASLYLERAKLKIAKGDLDPAMADLNTFCSLNKVCGEASLWKGIIRFRHGDYTGAIGYFSEYTLKHDEANAWFYLGLSHMWLQNYLVAINAFERSLSLQADQKAALYNAGLCAFYAELFERADSLLSAAHTLDPEDGDVRMALGLNMLRAGRSAESIKMFQSFVESDAHYPKALYNIGVNHYNLNALQEACDAWRHAEALGHLQATEALERHCGKH